MPAARPCSAVSTAEPAHCFVVADILSIALAFQVASATPSHLPLARLIFFSETARALQSLSAALTHSHGTSSIAWSSSTTSISRLARAASVRHGSLDSHLHLRLCGRDFAKRRLLSITAVGPPQSESCHLATYGPRPSSSPPRKEPSPTER